MANNSNQAYWKRIELKQKTTVMVGDTPAVREASPITIQIPQTGRQLSLERHYLKPGTTANVRIPYMSDNLFGAVDMTVSLLAVLLIGLLWYAARKLKLWVEVGLVSLVLLTEVMLDLVSAELAQHFLNIAIGTSVILGAMTIGRRYLKAPSFEVSPGASSSKGDGE